MTKNYTTQNELLLKNLLIYYNDENNLNKMLSIINGESRISLRIVDWFVTNFAKKDFTVYNIIKNNSNIRFKVYFDYKLKLKAYSKRRFDPFCRWERITIPYKDDKVIQTTIGQLNFFKWAIENNILNYIEQNLKVIEEDMNIIANIKNKSVSNKSCKKKTNYSEKNKSFKNNNLINNTADNTVDNTVDNTGNNTVNNTGDDTVNNTDKNKNKITKPNKKIIVQKNNTQKKTVNIETKGTTRRKRRELSESASKSLIKHNCKTVITFD